MKYIRIIIVLLCVFVSIPALGQKEADQDGGGLRQIAVEFGSSNWLVFKQNARYSGETLFSEAKEAFSLSSDDGMRMVSVVTDGMGYRHYRYQQTYKGVDVEGAVYCVHERDGRAVSANGQIVKNLNITDSPSITADSFMEMVRDQIRMSGGVERAMEVELVYTRRNVTLGFDASNYCLTYKITACDSVRYYDAETGTWVKSYSTQMGSDNCHTGSANTMYNGWQDITTKKRNNKYHLVDLCRGEGITAKYDNNIIFDYTSGDNIWNSNDKPEKSTISAFWAAEMAYDYFFNVFNRNSYDDNGSVIRVVTTNTCRHGASWKSIEKKITCGVMYPENDSNYNAFVSLDIIGHELTHAIVQHTSNLEYSGESGSLNESFADIFGTMIEFYVLSDGGDYIVGKEVTTDHTGLRNMSDPNQKDQPDTYQGNMWYTGDDESIKVHTNSGVQNYWFYLLAEGGEGVNDNNDAYEVQGIGRENAAMIAYYNMVYYMNSSCNYADARNGAILSAAELFGVHSIEFQSTIAAWDAVGVNNAGDLYYDIETDCETLRGMHNDQELPVSVYAIHGIESDCQYVDNQVPVQYCAGEYVLLTDGFCSGDNFTAYIFPDMIGGISDRGVPEPAYCAGRGVDGEDATVDSGVEVGADEVSLTIYPNPSTDHVNIVSSASIDNVVLYDITGRQLRRVDCPKVGARSGKIDIGSLALGVYMMEVRFSDGSTVIKRLIKR